MSLRVRSDGRILCAALHGEEAGDTYIDDGLHYEMSVVHKVIVTEPMPEHARRGEWWWRGQVPEGTVIDGFYDQGLAVCPMNARFSGECEMKAAISTLEAALHTLETNQPINRKEGNLAQADLEAINAAEIKGAIAILHAVANGPIWPEPVDVTDTPTKPGPVG